MSARPKEAYLTDFVHNNVPSEHVYIINYVPTLFEMFANE